jgi:DNA-binding transcriptional MerR regulator
MAPELDSQPADEDGDAGVPDERSRRSRDAPAAVVSAPLNLVTSSASFEGRVTSAAVSPEMAVPHVAHTAAARSTAESHCGQMIESDTLYGGDYAALAIIPGEPSMTQLERVEIPNRSLFRQPEVCELARIQPYVLRTWEAEFPDLGVAKTEGGPRVYRRADVERVLRIKHLLFVDGLTLAGARRKLSEEAPAPAAEDTALANLDELLGSDSRERILQVRRGLRELASMLARAPGAPDDGFVLEPAAPPARKKAAVAVKAVAVKKKKK